MGLLTALVTMLVTDLNLRVLESSVLGSLKKLGEGLLNCSYHTKIPYRLRLCLMVYMGVCCRPIEALGYAEWVIICDHPMTGSASIDPDDVPPRNLKHRHRTARLSSFIPTFRSCESFF